MYISSRLHSAWYTSAGQQLCTYAEHPSTHEHIWWRQNEAGRCLQSLFLASSSASHRRSPELQEVQGKGYLSKAADMYSFGVLLWEMFHGMPPYAADNGHLVNNASFPRFDLRHREDAPFSYVCVALACLSEDHEKRCAPARLCLPCTLRQRCLLGQYCICNCVCSFKRRALCHTVLQHVASSLIIALLQLNRLFDCKGNLLLQSFGMPFCLSRPVSAHCSQQPCVPAGPTSTTS